MSNLPRGKNADYWEGFHAEERRSTAMDTAELATRVARSMRKDAARKAAIIARHPQHFRALDQQEVGEMSGHAAAAHSLKQDGFAMRDGEDALRMREAVDHGIRLGTARARGSGDSMLFGGNGSMTEAEREEFFKGTKGGPEAAANLLGVAENPKRAPLDAAHDSASGSYMDRYLKT